MSARTVGSVLNSQGATLPHLKDALSGACDSGLSVSRLAALSGVGRSTIFTWMTRPVEPTASAWLLVSRTTGLDPVDLWLTAGGPDRGPLWEARVRKGWSPAALAEASGVSVRTVLLAESGTSLRSDSAARLAAALDVPVLVALLSPPAPTGSLVGLLLEQSRLSRGLSRGGLARTIGVSRQLLAAWQAGEDLMPLARVKTVADRLDLDAELLELARIVDLDRLHHPGSSRALAVAS